MDIKWLTRYTSYSWLASVSTCLTFTIYSVYFTGRWKSCFFGLKQRVNIDKGTLIIFWKYEIFWLLGCRLEFRKRKLGVKVFIFMRNRCIECIMLRLLFWCNMLFMLVPFKINLTWLVEEKSLTFLLYGFEHHKGSAWQDEMNIIRKMFPYVCIRVENWPLFIPPYHIIRLKLCQVLVMW